MTKITRNFLIELKRRIGQRQPFIQAVLGPRQVGKTTAVLELESSLNAPFYYCTADSPVPPGAEWLRHSWLTARAKAGDSAGVFVVDEVQKIEGWSEQVKILFDEERRRPVPLEVVILGSASWRLQSGLTESLAGRYELLSVPHWSFGECKESFGWDLNTYLKFGGYPAPARLIDEKSRWQAFMQDSILEPMLSRDLLSLKAIGKPALFRQSMQLALSYPAQELSLEKFLGQLQDKGNSTTVRGYLQLLEAGFVIKLLEKYSTRPLSSKSSSPKLLPLCPALIHSFIDPVKVDIDPAWRGRVFEAAIGSALHRSGAKLSYWRDGKSEVDYVLEFENRLVAVEVKSNSVKNERGLLEFKKNFPNAETILISEEFGEKLLEADNAAKFILALL